MSRLLVFIASLSFAFIAISSTCLAGPIRSRALAPASGSLVSADRVLADRSASYEAPSRMIGGGLLSL